jgi:hypothetical protein
MDDVAMRKHDSLQNNSWPRSSIGRHLPQDGGPAASSFQAAQKDRAGSSLREVRPDSHAWCAFSPNQPEGNWNE